MSVWNWCHVRVIDKIINVKYYFCIKIHHLKIDHESILLYVYILMCVCFSSVRSSIKSDKIIVNHGLIFWLFCYILLLVYIYGGT